MKLLVAIFVSAVLLFVVVCPVTPTPIAVLGGNVHVHTPAIATASFVFAAMPRLDIAVSKLPSESSPPALSADRLDLTCVRLC